MIAVCICTFAEHFFASVTDVILVIVLAGANGFLTFVALMVGISVRAGHASVILFVSFIAAASTKASKRDKTDKTQ